MDGYKEKIQKLLSNPDELKKKKPFYRGIDRETIKTYFSCVGINEEIDAFLPEMKMVAVSQDVFIKELDPNCHDVLIDDNIPAICVKQKDGSYYNVEYKKIAIPFQKRIKNKQTMHLANNPMQFTLLEQNPSETQQQMFVVLKQYWLKRNQDGMKVKMVDAQLSYGDAGLLYYFDYKGRIKSRLLTYKDGYVLCPHNDDNGDRILESVNYVSDGVEYIDSYDDRYMYRWTKEIEYSEENTEKGWVWHKPIEHGFDEIPLITKRGDVAWNDVQTLIDCYEALYNVFNVIQKKHGWGILYIKGNFRDNARRLAGNVVLQDTSIDGSGDAKYLTPPSPTGMLETLNLMFESIQLGSSTTFLLPKDIKTGGDLAGITIQLVQSLDMENALEKVIEWQNVASKMVRLFKQGLAKELVNYGIDEKAITKMQSIDVDASFKAWQPRDDYNFNQMLSILTGAGLLSKESGIELNTMSKPDELKRITKEKEAAVLEQQQLIAQQQTTEGENTKGKEVDGNE